MIKKLTEFFNGLTWTPLKISIIINVFLIIILFFMFRSSDPQPPKIIVKDRIVEIPGKEGKIDTIYKPKFIEKESKVNIELLKKYNALLSSKDSVAKLDLYKEAITENSYNESYEDKLVKIDIYTKVIGTVLKQAATYQIKPSTISIKDTTEIIYGNPKVNKVYIGAEVLIPFNQEKLALKGSLYFQNKNDNIITAGYDTNGIWSVGYIYKIKFKK